MAPAKVHTKMALNTQRHSLFSGKMTGERSSDPADRRHDLVSFKDILPVIAHQGGDAEFDCFVTGIREDAFLDVENHRAKNVHVPQ